MIRYILIVFLALSTVTHAQVVEPKKKFNDFFEKDKDGYIINPQVKPGKPNDYISNPTKSESLNDNLSTKSLFDLGKICNFSIKGPGCGGGGDLVMSTPSDVIESVYKMKEIFNNPHIYNIVHDAIRGSYIEIDVVNTLLIYFLNPNNKFEGIEDPQYGPLIKYRPVGRLSYDNKVENEFSSELNDITPRFREDACPSNNQEHAAASVISENSICFSLGQFQQVTKLSLDQEILGFWAHELAHLRGFNEDQAKFIQKLFYQSASELAPNYFNSASRMFRKVKDRVTEFQNDQYLESFKYSEEAIQYFGDVSRVQKLESLNEKVKPVIDLIEQFPSIQLCDSVPSKSKKDISFRYQKISGGLYQATSEARVAGHIFDFDKELDFRLFMYNREFRLNDVANCEPDSRLVCEDSNHRYYYYWNHVIEIHDRFSDLLNSTWLYLQQLYFSAEEMRSADNEFIDRKASGIFGYMLVVHTLKNQIILSYDKFIDILSNDMKSCDFEKSDPKQEDVRLFLLNTVSESRKRVQMFLDSPLSIFSKAKQKELLAPYWNLTLEEFLAFPNEAELENHIQSILSTVDKRLFVASVRNAIPEIQANYRDVFREIDVIQVYRDMENDPNPRSIRDYNCRSHSSNSSAYYDCLKASLNK